MKYNPAEFHALEDEDTYIIVSLANGTNQATVHVHGDSGEVMDLLAVALEAIDGVEQVTHH